MRKLSDDFLLFKVLLALLLCLTSACGGSGSSPSGAQSVPVSDSNSSAESGGSATQAETSPPDASACAEALESVTLTIPTVLSNTDSACDYYLTGTIRIKAELTIEPGTVVLMGQDAWVVVENGAINAVGTPASRIVIRGERDIIGFWQGIRFSYAQPSRIEYVDIMDAGNFANPVSSAQPGSIAATASTLSLVETTISNSNRDGAYLSSQLGNVRLSAFSNNRFFGNAGKALTVSGNLLDMLDADSDYHGGSRPNGDPVVVVEYTGLTTGDQTIKAINVPYRPTNAITASPDGDITLAPGVQMELGESFGRSTGALNGGRYVAIGTPEQPIVFTHSRTPAAQGVESVVEARDDGVVVLQHVQLQGVIARVGRDGTLQINDTSISDSPGYGIQCAPLALPIVGNSNITFGDNALGDYSPECLF